MLEVSRLSVRYGAVEALRDVSIRVPAGGFVAILGANGAGKSTLLRAISGLARPNSGAITLHGRAITGLKPEAIVRRGVSHVPEGRGVFPDLTVAENLAMGGLRAAIGASRALCEPQQKRTAFRACLKR